MGVRNMLPVIFGLSGPIVTKDEVDFFRHVNPAGFILFGRNIETPEQVRQLVVDLRACLDRDDVAILIDQEGGQVCRLAPPSWPAFPPAAHFGALYNMAPMTAIAAAKENARALGAMLFALGININCAPVLDVAVDGTCTAIGDRSFGTDPNMVAALGRATLDGLHEGGVAGVIKHIPGHGRATADSHLELPSVTADEVDLAQDIAPFKALASSPAAMIAHIVYTHWDAGMPASQSAIVIQSIIRDTIGFDGLLFSDDITMQALSGSAGDRAQTCLSAGVDIVLHCNGAIGEMRAVADAVPPITIDARTRLQSALSTAKLPEHPEFLETALARRDALMTMAA
jgi:beta-N-acetylhexosaminidase